MVYRNYVIRTLSVIRSGRIMCDACSTHEREDKCIVSFGRNNGGKKLREDLVVDGRIILKYFSTKSGYAAVD